MWALAGFLFLTSPLWMLGLRWFAVSKGARLILLVQALATGVVLAMMFVMGESCRPAQDLTYTPELCPALPGFVVHLVSLTMILGILLLPIVNLVGLIAAAGFEIFARSRKRL